MPAYLPPHLISCIACLALGLGLGCWQASDAGKPDLLSQRLSLLEAEVDSWRGNLASSTSPREQAALERALQGAAQLGALYQREEDLWTYLEVLRRQLHLSRIEQRTRSEQAQLEALAERLQPTAAPSAIRFHAHSGARHAP
ncbi:MAG: hypothetical protein EA402_07375 [Planctomycetota bacterium]|nr:MAG: hypothetical protein EA402_07375 [Planctomycetota bacterium]